MSSQDFVRQSNGLQESTGRSLAVWRTLHIDPPLLVGIVSICCFGLMVLFSASDGVVVAD